MRNLLFALSILLGSIAPAGAQVSVGVGFPGVSIGIHVPAYPELVPIPGYPVYYAPRLGSNYFFYDGMYWVYDGDNWYASSWYNGPWEVVGPEAVPLFVLRVPVRYYRRPPAYFGGWRADAPPHWGEHWGSAWAQRRNGWDQWNRASAPRPAPLPLYQRQYSGNRYPAVEQQQVLLSRNYRYQPQDSVARQHFARVQSAPADSRRVAQPAPSSPAAAPRIPQAQNAPRVPREKEAQSTEAAPKVTPQAQSAPAAPARVSQRAPEERNAAHQNQRTPGAVTQQAQSAPTAPPRVSQRSIEEKNAARPDQRANGQPSSSFAQSHAPTVQRAQPPQHDVQRNAAVNAPPRQAAPAVQHQPEQQRVAQAPRAQQAPAQEPKRAQQKVQEKEGEHNK